MKTGSRVLALIAVSLLLSWAQAATADSEGDGSPARTTSAPVSQADARRIEAENRDALLAIALKPWKGDLDGMVKRRMVRALVVYDPIYYFVDHFEQYGIAYEIMELFQKELNRRLGLRGANRIEIVYVPVGPDRLIPNLLGGVGDIALSGITVTPERQARVDFSTPFMTGVEEVLVSGKDYGDVASAEDLSGRTVAVRPTSSYAQSLNALNAKLMKVGAEPVAVITVDENLTDGALAELVLAGTYPATVMDSDELALWTKIYPGLVVHSDVVLRKDGKIAWAIRKNSPKLKAEVDRFAKAHRAGTKIANVLIDRYLKNTRHVKEIHSAVARERLERTVEIFKTYADKYEFDWRLLVAQSFQESRLHQSLVSAAGAVGLMQLLPATAAAPPIDIRDIHKAGNNVHAGAKYMRYIIDTYFDDPAIEPIDRHLMALAGYNAGPARVAALRKTAKAQGLDPNLWFNNVEIVAGHHLGRQPVDYVRNIFKYFVAYARSSRLKEAERAAEKAAD